MGTLFAVSSGICWAAYNLAVRRGLESMDSGAGYVITLVFGTLASLAMMLLPLPGHGATMISKLSLLWLAMSGITNTVVGRWALFRNIALVGPSRASAWKNATPLYTLVFGFLLLGERPSAMSVAGTVIILAGLMLLSREQAGSDGEIRSQATLRTAMVLGVVSGVCFSAAMLFRKAGLNAWPDTAGASAMGGLAALIGYLPYALAKGDVARVRQASRQGVSAFLLAGAFSALAQLFAFLSLRVTMAATTQVIAALEPLFTMALSTVFMGRQEKLHMGLVGSAAVVFVGVVLIALR